MSSFQIKKAVRHAAYLRIGLVGPSGSGKTYTSLKIARGLVGPSGRICLIDSERGSASLYADDAECAGSFDVIELNEFSPANYRDCLQYIAQQKYDAVIIDSLSHAWMGAGGALEMVDAAAAREKGNSYTAWRYVTPEHNKMVDSILNFPGHLIATMRAKTEYVIEDQNGKKVPRKIGMAPIQRDGMEYEFTVTADLDINNTMVISKSRCPQLSGKIFNRAGKDVADVLTSWLNVSSNPLPVEHPEPVKQMTDVQAGKIGMLMQSAAYSEEDRKTIVKKVQTGMSFQAADKMIANMTKYVAKHQADATA